MDFYQPPPHGTGIYRIPKAEAFFFVLYRVLISFTGWVSDSAV